MKNNVLLLLFILPFFSINQTITETFSSSKIINAQSVETLKKRHFEYHIEHRFGDAGGKAGGVDNGFGFDNAADIRFAVLYGLSDKLLVGFGRSKGSFSAYKSVLDGSLKYKIFEQKTKGFPFSISFYASSTYSYVGKSSNINDFHYFTKSIHRLAYCSQLIIAKKFGSWLSFALQPTLIHRNYVRPGDENTLFALGSGLNIKFSKSMGLLIDYFHAFRKTNPGNVYQDALAVGFEYLTNGHRFSVSFSNSSLFNETQFIPATIERWDLGQYRLGFTISRTFKF
ncbi:MAG: hypothetical protein HYU67_06640 [Flavobacteriia bacterium]|nr:hypothetical protein [Flavobacteriia bacterium]